MRDYDLSQLRILVVDGNRHFAAIIRAILRSFGARQILEATDAIKALEILKQTHIDIALIELKIGDIGGIELIRLIRNSPDSQNHRLPIIIITAFSERSNVEAAISVGVDEFLVKPVSPQKLCERIRWVIDNPRPFVRFGSYYGPDRRSQDKISYEGSERRSGEEVAI